MAEPCSQHAAPEFFTASYTQEHLKLALQFYLWLPEPSHWEFVAHL